MNENGREAAEPTLQEMLDRYRGMKRQGDELVIAMHREAADRERDERERDRILVEKLHREAIEKADADQLRPCEPPTVHYTDLPPAQPHSQLGEEWDSYRRGVARLLADGEEGRFVLIKGKQIIGIWDTQEEAEAVAYHKYPLEPRLIHQVQRRERVLRGPLRLWRCPS